MKAGQVLNRGPAPRVSMDADRDDDIRLIGAARKGDADAFRRLIQKHQDPVFDLCLRMLGSPQDAEDVAQDTFLILFRRLADFRPEHKLSNWLYTIALNRCRRQLRRRRLLRWLSLDFTPPEDPEEGPALQVPSGETPPDAALEQAEAEAWTRSVLAGIPDNLREAFVLRHVKKLSYEEVADALKLSLPNVKVRLHRAKLFLLKKYGSGAGETGPSSGPSDGRHGGAPPRQAGSSSSPSDGRHSGAPPRQV